MYDTSIFGKPVRLFCPIYDSSICGQAGTGPPEIEVTFEGIRPAGLIETLVGLFRGRIESIVSVKIICYLRDNDLVAYPCCGQELEKVINKILGLR